MKLLILTQKIDSADPVLGFFHEWVLNLSTKCEQVTVICLQKGALTLPENVKVLSLGKEDQASRLGYLFNFYKYLWQERKNYETVFVHMNQEYILLAGWLWRLLNKNLFLWRNHSEGNFLTKISVFLANTVFCTSKYSYTAQFAKTRLMPAGIDTDYFRPYNSVLKKEKSVLFLGRLSAIKKPELFIKLLAHLKNEGVIFEAQIVGDSPDQKYFEVLKKQVEISNLVDEVTFIKGVPNKETLAFYRTNKVYVNLTPSGSLDKTILEAMASGSLILTTNQSFMREIPDCFFARENDLEDLSQKLKFLLNLPENEVKGRGETLRQYVVQNHSLKSLVERLKTEMTAFSETGLNQFLRYLVAGGLVVLTNIVALFSLTHYLKIWYLTSSVIAFFIAFIVSFFVQRLWTFSNRSVTNILSQLWQYFLTSIFNLVANTIILFILVDWLHFHYILAQILTVGVIALVLFFVYRDRIFEKALEPVHDLTAKYE